MPLITTRSGKQFPLTEGQSLLDAALAAQVGLPYSCHTGRCSTCKAKVRAGSTQPLSDELGLTPEERAQGWILTCVRTASSDVTLEVEDLGNVRLHPPKLVPCRIQALERLAPDVMKVLLRLPPANPVPYYPGQYVDVIGPQGVRRSYSVANAPAANQPLELHVRQVAGGAMSHYWFEQAKPNDLLRLNGPLGTFFLREVAGMDLVFLATGTGIAPVKAMLEGLASLASEARPRAVTVYWGGRVSADLYWQPTVAGVELSFVPVLSKADADWHGARGHVQQVLLATGGSLAVTAVYACGSNAMIHSAQAALLAAGLPPARFYSDAFVCSAAT